VRRFYVGSSDYSAYVNKWPSIQKKWDDLRPQQATIDLSNEGGTFNFLTTDPTKMRTTCAIDVGVRFAADNAFQWGLSEWNGGDEYYGGADETFTAFAGTIDSARYSGGQCSIQLADKFRRLTDRKIGDTTTPSAYTSSSYLVHDLAWYTCTSLGGLSAVANSSNPDIDYMSFSSWSSVFSADNVRMRAQFTGQQPLEVLKKLAMLTQSAIFIEDDRLKFVRYSLVGANVIDIDNGLVLDATTTLDDRALVNKQFVSADYDVASRSFGITVVDVSTGSIGSYGVREKLAAEQFVWFVDSVSALNLAQRVVATQSELRGRHVVRTPMRTAAATIGDTLSFADPLMGINDSFRVMGETLDLDSGVKTFEIDRTQYFGGFVLDVSALDGTDILV
jgi:hypothetical protein